MSAVVIDLFVEDPFTGLKVPNVGSRPEFMVVQRHHEASPGFYVGGAVAIFAKRHEAVAWISQQTNPGLYFIEHIPGSKPVIRK